MFLNYEMDSRPLIQDSLQMISFIYLNPLSTHLNNQFYGRCIAVIGIGTFIDVCLYLCFNYQGTESSIDVLIVIGYLQNTIKLLFFLAYRKEIILLLNNVYKFWNLNSSESKQLEENKKIFFIVKFCIRSYLAFLIIICILYLTKPLFLPEVELLPWNTCCSHFLNYKVCYMIQILQVAVIVLAIAGFDTFYISLITNIICEFKLIENDLPDIKINPAVCGTDKEAMIKLKELIDHHNLILGCTKILKHVYRNSMLCLFFANMFGMCFALIIMTTSTSKATNFLFGILTIFYLVQVFFFCIFGSLLADESVKISTQVYKSKWWIKTQPELRKALIMVIQRSNNPEVLTAGGLLQVDLATFRMILRSTVTFFTFMQVIYGNS